MKVVTDFGTAHIKDAKGKGGLMFNPKTGPTSAQKAAAAREMHGSGGSGKWDENKHPRRDDGKFGSGSGKRAGSKDDVFSGNNNSENMLEMHAGLTADGWVPTKVQKYKNTPSHSSFAGGVDRTYGSTHTVVYHKAGVSGLVVVQGHGTPRLRYYRSGKRQGPADVDVWVDKAGKEAFYRTPTAAMATLRKEVANKTSTPVPKGPTMAGILRDR